MKWFNNRSKDEETYKFALKEQLLYTGSNRVDFWTGIVTMMKTDKFRKVASDRKDNWVEMARQDEVEEEQNKRRDRLKAREAICEQKEAELDRLEAQLEKLEDASNQKSFK